MNSTVYFKDFTSDVKIMRYWRDINGLRFKFHDIRRVNFSFNFCDDEILKKEIDDRIEEISAGGIYNDKTGHFN